MENTIENSNESNFTDLSEAHTNKSASLDIVSINQSKLFDSTQCDEILNSAIEELWLPTKVVGEESLHSGHRQKLRGDLTGFPFMDIRTVTKSANDKIYDFGLLGIIDQDFPQVFRYSKKDHYDWHIDLNLMTPSRKLTFIINLSSKDSYEGGEIEFLNIDTSSHDLSEQGSCLIFPSYMPYRIKEIKAGTKFLIIGHVHGALFR